jgi:hypothetical protein
VKNSGARTPSDPPGNAGSKNLAEELISTISDLF